MDKAGAAVKAGSLTKPITIKEVENGCEHVKRMTETPETAEKFTTAYTTLQKLVAKPCDPVNQTTKDPKNPHMGAITCLRSTYHCLQCAHVGDLKGRDTHYETCLHALSIESRSGFLHCAICKDFIYDPTFERIRIEMNPSSSMNDKKRKLDVLYPQREEDELVSPNSNELSCMAGAPRGMYNLGQTCYMSVILQAMIHNPFMPKHFLSSRHDTTECTEDLCIPCAMIGSFADVLATEKTEGHGPVELLFKTWKHNPNLAGYKQQDAHEFFQFLVDQLHTTTGSANKKACDCLYHNVFYGKLNSSVTCLACRNVTISEDPIIDLSLDLRNHAKKSKLDHKSSVSTTNHPDDHQPLHLSTCLKNFTTPEKLQPDAYTCRSDKCGHTAQRAKKHLTIKKLPPTLCIQLKRYEHSHLSSSSQKLNTKLLFPLQLDMLPYTTFHKRQPRSTPPSSSSKPSLHSSTTSPRSPGWYDLSSVIVHAGKIDAGHYTCFCKREGGQWLRFDDQKVTLASEKEVLDADAYLLFYVVRCLGKGAG
ncbi:hypothetical protein MMC20_004186 [Loxospora ochrophaea]|nr:hypothetical protein [Loxospora ochrophaea]